MRLFATLFLLLTIGTSASEIDLVLIQFPEPKTTEALNEALAKVDLAEITNSNRTMTKELALQGGVVLFAHRTEATKLNTSTRLGDVRADVTGSYTNDRLEVKITISEGVDAGLRSFKKRLFQGAAELPRNSTRVISIRQIKRKSTIAEKGRSEFRQSETTTALIARSK